MMRAGRLMLRCPSRAALAAAMFMLAPALAGSTLPPETLSALTSAERRASDTSVPLREREAAVDRAIDLRRELIADADESDERLPGWLMEQGAVLLTRLTRDGSDTAALFGLALPAHRDAATAAATEAADLLRRAERLLPGSHDAEQDRTVRIPFFLARAELLLAACASGEQRVRHASKAHDLVSRIILSEPAPEAVRRVNLAMALLLRNGDAADAEIALDELAWVLTREGREAAAILPLTRAEAWMGLMHASAAMNKGEAFLDRYQAALLRHPFVAGETADPLLTVLAHDAATRALFEQGRRTSSLATMELAAQQQAALLARTDLPMRAESLRPLVYEKLTLLAGSAGDETPIPGSIRTARAVIHARDPQHRETAIAALRELASEQAAGPFAPDALWELAVLLTQPANGAPSDAAILLEAARALLELAERHASSPRAGDAIAAALTYARSLTVRHSSESPQLDEADAAAARQIYAHALEIATTSYPRLADIDLWRYERARLLLEEYQQIASAGGDTAAASTWLENALGAARDISTTSSIAADAKLLTERLHLARLDALWAAHRAAKQAGADPYALAETRIAPAAREAVAWARANSSAHADRFRLDLIEALLSAADDPAAVHTGLAGAQQMLGELLPRFEAESNSLLPRATLAKARLLIASNDHAAAFPLLRTIAQQLEPHITPLSDEAPDSLHNQYWHAWTLMIEILAREASGPRADESRAATLRLHIRRLQSLDPSLGGPPWHDRILAARPSP